MPFIGQAPKSTFAAAIDNASITTANLNAATITLFKEKKANATSGATSTNNLAVASSFEHTATQDFTANFTNVPGTNTTSWTLEVNNDGTAHTITWQVAGADSMQWAEGQVPPPSTGTDVYSFIAIAGEVYGSLAVRNAS